MTRNRTLGLAGGLSLVMAVLSGCGTAPQSTAATAPLQTSQSASAAPSSGSTFVRGDSTVPAGSFGGSGIMLSPGATPQSSGQVAVLFNCANGTIPIDLSQVQSGSSFDAEGTWVSRSGPITPAGHPTLSARYAGTLEGNHLELTVTIEGADGSPTTTQTTQYDAYEGQSADYNQACPL